MSEETLSLYGIAEAVTGEMARSSITTAFRDAIVMEVIRIARPLIEAPFIAQLETLKDRALTSPNDTDSEIAAELQAAIDRLAIGSASLKP